MGNKCAPCLGKSHTYDHDRIQSKLEDLEESFDQVSGDARYSRPGHKPMIQSATSRGPEPGRQSHAGDQNTHAGSYGAQTLSHYTTGAKDGPEYLEHSSNTHGSQSRKDLELDSEPLDPRNSSNVDIYSEPTIDPIYDRKFTVLSRWYSQNIKSLI